MGYAGSTCGWKAHLFRLNSYGSMPFGKSETMNQLITPVGKFADRSRYNDTTRIADKSLARPTFRCRRTESIVSLERGVCSCAELQAFSCYRG